MVFEMQFVPERIREITHIENGKLRIGHCTDTCQLCAKSANKEMSKGFRFPPKVFEVCLTEMNEAGDDGRFCIHVGKRL